MKKRINRAKIKFILLIAIIVSAIAFYTYFSFKGYDISDEIKFFVEDNQKVAPLIFISLFVISSFFPLPLLTILGATLFSFGGVFVYSIIGNVINATIIFYLARLLGRDFISYFEAKHKKIKELDMKFKKNAFKDMILLRMFYPIPVEVGNVAGGLSSMKFKDYILGSMIGLIPVLFASILIVKGKLADNNFIITSAIILFVILLIIPIIYLAGIRKYSKGKFNAAKKKVRKFARFR